MTAYRICCRYYPEFKRLGGQKKGSTERLVKRGAWRVHEWFVSEQRDVPFYRNDYCHTVSILSPRPIGRGVLVNPFKLLKRWQFINRRYPGERELSRTAGV